MRTITYAYGVVNSIDVDQHLYELAQFTREFVINPDGLEIARWSA